MNPTVPMPVNALEALGHWAPIVWLKTNPYAYPSLEILHIIGIALVFGTLWIIDMRILGLMRSFDVNQLARHIIPWTIAGFLLVALSGFTMFVSRAGDLINNPAFVVKMCLVFAAGTNAAVLHARGAIVATMVMTKAQAILSILIWVAVIACGRWIAYV
ncbi:MAG: hypothetical protein LH481_13405 [Burkholderiales bacterium]|nr:hypothetical protein [Burkholderiales bacterium]